MGVTDKDIQPTVLAHYERVGAFLERSFGGSPIVYANFPAGFAAGAHFSETDVPLTATKLLWLCHREYAIEFHSWAPAPQDRDRLRFARILLEPSRIDFDHVKAAALAVRSALIDVGMEAVPILDGLGGIALWIPLTDTPLAETVRAWLHLLCQRIVSSHGALVSTEANTHPDARVHLHVSSNAAGRWSVLPYSLRGRDSTPIATPFAWPELGALREEDTSPSAFANRLAEHGDIFAREVAAISAQRFSDAKTPHA